VRGSLWGGGGVLSGWWRKRGGKDEAGGLEIKRG